MFNFSVLAVLLVLPVSFAVNQHSYCESGDCMEGQKKDTNGHCIPCDNCTYTPFNYHSCETCFPCDGEIPLFNSPRSCIECRKESDNKYISSKYAEDESTLRMSNTTTSKAVPDDETTSTRNDLSTSETTNAVNETANSPTSNFTTTAPPKAGGDSKVTTIVPSAIGALVVAVVAAVVIYKYRSRFCPKAKYFLAKTSPPPAEV